MSNTIPYHYEIGRFTGLPTASHAARFALVHNVPLMGFADLDLLAQKEIAQRSVPLIKDIVVLAEAASSTLAADSWTDATEQIADAYQAVVDERYREPIEQSDPVINWLHSLDKIYGAGRMWRKLTLKVYTYRSAHDEPKFRNAVHTRVGRMVSEAVIEGAMTTAAYLDVIPRIAAREFDDPEAALSRCLELVNGSAPFIVEASGFGKAMNDVVLEQLSVNPASFTRTTFDRTGQDKYWRLRLGAANFEVRDSGRKDMEADYVGLTTAAQEQIMGAYNALPQHQQDGDQLFGCPAHAAAGIVKMYRSMSRIGFEGGIFAQAIQDEYHDRQTGVNTVDNGVKV